MPRKPAPKWDDPEESKRFLEEAEKVGASDDPKDFERALKMVAPKAPRAKDGG
ncbi:MAG: hypothetical protein LC674_02765 [Actinobacteria bacterium]|nr:hypothetical protein [Actinomycetota bacterium]